MFLMLSWRSYQRCGQTMWSGWRFPLSSLHGRDTGWICNISWRGVTLTGSRYCCGPATLRIFSGGSECIVSSEQLQGVIISSLVKPPSSTHGHFCHNFSRSNLGHFVEKILHCYSALPWSWYLNVALSSLSVDIITPHWMPETFVCREESEDEREKAYKKHLRKTI